MGAVAATQKGGGRKECVAYINGGIPQRRGLWIEKITLCVRDLSSDEPSGLRHQELE